MLLNVVGQSLQQKLPDPNGSSAEFETMHCKFSIK